MIRQRSRRACEPCRKRKVKCDGQYPCDVCKGYGYDCSFPDGSEKPKKKACIEAAVEAPAAADLPTPATATSPSPHILAERGTEDNWSCFVEVPNNKDLKLSASPFPESLISRFTTVYSSVAFPRELGQSLDMPNAPRLHPFAWNAGTREERLPHLGNRIFNQIRLQDALHHAKTYFEIVHPVFCLLERAHFTRMCIAAWSLRQLPMDLEAMLCCVVVLGSLFSSAPPWPMESAIADQAGLLLNISTSSPPSQLSLKFVVSWILRAIYLRCTTRPHLSWMATCNAMHIAEAIGLQQEFGKMDVLRERPREVATRETIVRRKTFWVAMSLNKLFSIEYGRTPVTLDWVSCAPLEKDEGDFTAAFVNLCLLMPNVQTVDKDELGRLLQGVASLQISEPPFRLFKADLCFMIFRKMRFLHMPLSIAQQELMLRIIQFGLAEAKSLSSIRSTWWNVISVPFHSVAVLIAMNTNASLSILPEAVETLKVVSSAYDTHLAREALQTAKDLLQGFQSKKINESDVLEHILTSVGLGTVSTDRQQANRDLGLPFGFDWPSEDDGSWMEVFLNMGTDQYSS